MQALAQKENMKYSIAVVVYKPSKAVIDNANKIFASVVKTLPEVERIVIDNSPTTHADAFSCDKFKWNDGYNIYWAGGINQAVELATGRVFIHFLPTRGIERNPNWVKKLVAPLSVPQVGMTGPVLSCSYSPVTGDLTGLPEKQVHVQQAVFAARTSVLKQHPWGPNHPHAYSDVEQSIKLLRARYLLVNVKEVSSVAASHASNPNSYFEAGPHIRECQ